jgi:hypothetical protein
LVWFKNGIVKRLTSTGIVLVQFSNRQTRNFSRHDKWPDHCTLFALFDDLKGLSGTNYRFLVTALKSGGYFHYPFWKGTDEELVAYKTATKLVWQSPDGLVGYDGEIWNLLQRGLVFDKVPSSKIIDWLISH